MSERAEWVAPLPGHWRRDFRLAEWLPGPASRSCETWLLPALDRGFSETSQEEYGSGSRAGVCVVNGWTYCTDPMPTRPLGLLTHSPLRMVRMAVAMARMFTRPEGVERHVAIPGHERYRTIDLPALQAAIIDVERRRPDTSPGDLVDMVDGLAVATGRLMLGMAQSMGFAGKIEYAMARHFTDHLADRVDCRLLDLSAGHVTPAPTPAHAVVTLDWAEPTASERGILAAPDEAITRRLVQARTTAESACRAALAGDQRALRRFDLLAGMLARWIPVREAMAAEFTLAWPAMRAALADVGAALVSRGAIDGDDDVFELTRDEVVAALAGDGPTLQEVVRERRILRRQRQALSPPLSLGKPVRQWKQFDRVSAVLRSERPADAQVLVTGLGSSAGTVTGVARVIRGPEDFPAFQPGEILVAPGTAPAWTLLFSMAAGVVTEGGGPFAHTSVVAREFGIPAIVTATGATTIIRTGDVITLDAASGSVSVGRPGSG